MADNNTSQARPGRGCKGQAVNVNALAQRKKPGKPEDAAESDGGGAVDEALGSEEVHLEAEADGDDDLTLAEAVELCALGWD